jgi:hypothetical protein
VDEAWWCGGGFWGRWEVSQVLAARKDGCRSGQKEEGGANGVNCRAKLRACGSEQQRCNSRRLGAEELGCGDVLEGGGVWRLDRRGCAWVPTGGRRRGVPNAMRVGGGMPTHYYSSAPAEPAAPRKPSARTDSDSDGRLGPLRGRGALGGSSVPAVSQRRDAARALAPVSLACVAAVRGQGPPRCNNEMMRERGRGHTVQASQDAEARPSPHLTSPRRSCKRRAGRAGQDRTGQDRTGQAGTSSRRAADTHSGAGLDERGAYRFALSWCRGAVPATCSLDTHSQHGEVARVAVAHSSSCSDEPKRGRAVCVTGRPPMGAYHGMDHGGNGGMGRRRARRRPVSSSAKHAGTTAVQLLRRPHGSV